MTIRQLKLSSLPAAQQLDLIRALDTSAIISPRQPLSRLSVGLWFALISSLLLAYTLIFDGYGELNIGPQPTVMIGAYAFAIAGIVVSALGFIHLRRLKRLSYKPGLYAFALDLIDVQADRWTIIPTSVITKVEVTHHESEGYDYSTITFKTPFGKKKLRVEVKAVAERFPALFETRRGEALAALASGELETLGRLDPFVHQRTTPQGWEQAGIKQATELRLTPLVQIALIAAVIGAALSAPLWYLRQTMSDDARFKAAQAAPLKGTPDRVLALELYLDGALNHKQEVITKHLPQARYDQAALAGDAATLREFLMLSKDEALNAQARAKLNTLYQDALTKFEAQAPKDDAKLKAFLAALFTYLQREDAPTIDVIFQPPSSSSLAQLDAKLASLDPKPRPLAEDLKDAQLAPLEAKLAPALSFGALSIGPRALFTFVAAPRTPREAMRYPRPTLRIDYAVRLVDERYDAALEYAPPLTRFALDCTLTAIIPEHEQRWEWSFNVEPDAQLPAAEDGTYKDVVQSTIFGLNEQVIRLFFAQDSDAFDRAFGLLIDDRPFKR